MRATGAGSDADEGARDPAGCRPGGVHGSREEFGGKGGRKASRRGVRRRGRPDRGRYGQTDTGDLLHGRGAGGSAYSEADCRVDTENLTPDRVAGKVLHLLARGTKGGPSGERAGKERRGR